MMKLPVYRTLLLLLGIQLLMSGSCLPTYAQMVRKDSLNTCTQMVRENSLNASGPPKPVLRKSVGDGLIQFKDGMVTVVRETGRTLRRVGRQFNAIDTNYISPNRYNLAFMLEQSIWHEQYRLGGKGGGEKQRIRFSPDPGFKLGIYFGWRWIFLGYTFDIESLTGSSKNKPKKTEMALNLYSSKFGVDLYYRKTGSDFKIRSTEGFQLDEPIKDVPFDGLQSKIRGLNAYWIFNYKRFSYPAAYSQSTNQRRSAGSFMAGLSYSQHRIQFDAEKLPAPLQQQLHESLRFQKVKYNDYSLQVGYGYNWVFAKNCVANLTLLPALAYKHTQIDEIEQQNYFIKDLNFDLITRAALVYNNSKYFVGASLVMHTYDYRKRDFTLQNTFGTIRLYAGFNFWKKKEYRTDSKKKK